VFEDEGERKGGRRLSSAIKNEDSVGEKNDHPAVILLHPGRGRKRKKFLGLLKKEQENVSD